jgi:hypothetical protein
VTEGRGFAGAREGQGDMTDNLLLIFGVAVVVVGAVLIGAARFGASRRAVVAEVERLEQTEADDLAA